MTARSRCDTKATRLLRQYCESCSLHVEEIVVAVAVSAKNSRSQLARLYATRLEPRAFEFRNRTVTTGQGNRPLQRNQAACAYRPSAQARRAIISSSVAISNSRIELA